MAEYPLGTAARMIRVARDEIGVAETGEIIDRELDSDELKQQEIDEAKWLAEQLAKEAEEAAKIASRQALLDKLGITENEAKLLLS